MITERVRERARTPVLVKLTPNITDIRVAARAAKLANADGLSAINAVNSITGSDLNTFEPRPMVDAELARRVLWAGSEADCAEYDSVLDGG